jgi:hypothetical protein
LKLNKFLPFLPNASKMRTFLSIRFIRFFSYSTVSVYGTVSRDGVETKNEREWSEITQELRDREGKVGTTLFCRSPKGLTTKCRNSNCIHTSK